VNELIIFVNTPFGDPESPVFDAFHEEPASAWGIIAPTFTEFLGQYTGSKGNPETIGATPAKTAEQLRWTPSPEEWKGLHKPRAIIRRSTSYLTLYPNEYFSYILRGEALLESGRTEEAGRDLNRAVELNPRSPYGRYIRSQLYIKEERFDDALKDLDVAVDHTPTDPFYLAARRDLYLHLNEHEKAAEDEKIIEELSTE